VESRARRRAVSPCAALWNRCRLPAAVVAVWGNEELGIRVGRLGGLGALDAERRAGTVGLRWAASYLTWANRLLSWVGWVCK
jgi:hypothetical protein